MVQSWRSQNHKHVECAGQPCRPCSELGRYIVFERNMGVCFYC